MNMVLVLGILSISKKTIGCEKKYLREFFLKFDIFEHISRNQTEELDFVKLCYFNRPRRSQMCRQQK